MVQGEFGISRSSGLKIYRGVEVAVLLGFGLRAWSSQGSRLWEEIRLRVGGSQSHV